MVHNFWIRSSIKPDPIQIHVIWLLLLLTVSPSTLQISENMAWHILQTDVTDIKKFHYQNLNSHNLINLLHSLKATTVFVGNAVYFKLHLRFHSRYMLNENEEYQLKNVVNCNSVTAASASADTAVWRLQLFLVHLIWHRDEFMLLLNSNQILSPN